MKIIALSAVLLALAGQACAAEQYPTDFAAAARTQPVDPNWAKPYKPKSRRDFTGVWRAQGGIGWVPGIPPGEKQNPPLTPEYARIFKQHLDDGAAGRPTGDITADCLPQGMPRIMTMTYPMEIMMNEIQVNIFAEWQEQTRRIFLDGRPLDLDADPTFYGQTTGHWEGDVLVATTLGLHPDTDLESSGLPKSEKMIVYERLWLADDDTLKDEITLVDAKALARPWTVTKTYLRGKPGFKLMQYVCLENNRNTAAADGSTGVVLQSGAKKP
ncbi:MAG: hypothetical protein ABIO37_02560 [Caulobacteraceae bacterium]